MGPVQKRKLNEMNRTGAASQEAAPVFLFCTTFRCVIARFAEQTVAICPLQVWHVCHIMLEFPY